MIRIVVISKPECIACDIVKKVIKEAINKRDESIDYHEISCNAIIDSRYNIKMYPTTLFFKDEVKKLENDFGTFESYTPKEIARLEGSFPIDYLNKVIDKLKLEQ